MLTQLTEARDRAQIELASAEIVLLEASAAAGTLREEVSRLEAAVLALKGQTPALAEVAALSGVEPPAPLQDTQIGAESTQSGDRAAAAELSPEEFDVERKRKQRVARKRQKEEELANNPLAHVKCSGCGRTGTMQDVLKQAPSGATVRMLVCYKCNNQVMT